MRAEPLRHVRDHLSEVIDRVEQHPKRVGKPLRGDLAGVWSARRGTDCALYRIREQGRPGEEQGGEDRREVIVLRIEHRRNVYRPF